MGNGREGGKGKIRVKERRKHNFVLFSVGITLVYK
jgi:hypothetical protein